MNDEWLKQLEQERRQKIEQAKANLFGYLAEHHPHIAHIKVEYSGYGDEGDVGDTYYYNSLDDDATDVELKDEEMDKLLNDVFNHATPEGFEVNDGGNGEIHIFPNCKQITVEHYYNIVHQEYETYEV